MTYDLADGRQLCVTIEGGMWAAWISGDERSLVMGWPLEGVIQDALGFDVAHDEPSEAVLELAGRVRADFPDAADLDAKWRSAGSRPTL